MSQRKPWTKKEDETLKILKEVRKLQKWSQISEIMRKQFQIYSRNGKKCRQRYHNHLDSSISKHSWTSGEEQLLLDLHDKLGNRWASISRQIPGRTDNCVKNHFYSYFRKCLKNINTLIPSEQKKRIRPLKLTLIAKIITAIQTYHNNPNEPHNYDELQYLQARQIKNIILTFPEQNQQALQKFKLIIPELFSKLSQFNQKGRRKLFKKKKVKLQSEQSHHCKESIEGSEDSQVLQDQIQDQLYQKDHKSKNKITRKQTFIRKNSQQDFEKINEIKAEKFNPGGSFIIDQQAKIGANLGPNIGSNIGANIGSNIGANIEANIEANIGTNKETNTGSNLGESCKIIASTESFAELKNQYELGGNIFDTPKKWNGQKQRIPSYHLINSIEYAQKPENIGVDDEKQWRLFFD